MKLCTPAVVYLVLAAIALILQLQNYASSKNPFLTIIAHVLFIGLWTAVLNWICDKGYKAISWALVIIPYAFMFLTVFVTAQYLALRQAGF
jgi:hypothetical protein